MIKRTKCSYVPTNRQKLFCGSTLWLIVDFWKRDNLTRRCTTTAGNKLQSLSLEMCCLPRPGTTLFVQWLRPKRLIPHAAYFYIVNIFTKKREKVWPAIELVSEWAYLRVRPMVESALKEKKAKELQQTQYVGVVCVPASLCVWPDSSRNESLQIHDVPMAPQGLCGSCKDNCCLQLENK